MDARTEALADYLERKVGPAKLDIGTRVSVRSFKGAIGTVVGPDGYPRGSALAVRMDRPFPEGWDDGYACVSVGECTVVDEERPDCNNRCYVEPCVHVSGGA